MKRLALATLLVSLWAPAALAAGPLKVEAPWVREAPPTARVLAGYATFRNAGAEPDALVAVKTEVADRVEIHTMAMRGGVMRMQAIPFLEIPAKGTAKLVPGGAHLMIYDPKRPLRDGETVPMTFVFRGGTELRLSVPVRKVQG
ncbi:copper chaperone PCu(A)C [bacterium]|nr:copper chaperone PCu(A)C [bacterium]